MESTALKTWGVECDENWISKLAGTCRRASPEGKHSKTSRINNQPPNTCRSSLRAGKGRAEGLSSNGVFSSVQFSSGTARDWNQRSGGEPLQKTSPCLWSPSPCTGLSPCAEDMFSPALLVLLYELLRYLCQEGGIRERALGQDWRHYLPQSSHFNLPMSENIRIYILRNVKSKVVNQILKRKWNRW